MNQWASEKEAQSMIAQSDKSGDGFSRRRFLANTSALSVASLLAVPRPAAAEPPPETTTIRTAHGVSMCEAPQSVAEELLRVEGFN
jgi:NitT/TauT family transport system substrate-binding protein